MSFTRATRGSCSRLGRAAQPRSRRGGVHAVFQDIERERAEIHSAEIVEAVVQDVKLIVLVRPAHPLDEPLQPMQDEAVDGRRWATGTVSRPGSKS